MFNFNSKIWLNPMRCLAIHLSLQASSRQTSVIQVQIRTSYSSASYINISMIALLLLPVLVLSAKAQVNLGMACLARLSTQHAETKPKTAMDGSSHSPDYIVLSN